MTIGSKSWREGILYKTTNNTSGFIAAGLCPLSLLAMQRQFKSFKNGGVVDLEENLTWMRCRETFQTEVLSLQTESDRKRGGRQLT